MSPRNPTWKTSFCTWCEEGDAGINTYRPKCDGEFRRRIPRLVGAAEAFAVSKGLTIVALDGGKTGEEMASDRRYPGGMNG
jgi:hypothetical protein